MNLHSINTSYFENNMLVLDGNKLTLKHQAKEIALSKNEARLLIILANGINDKQNIIEFIWGHKNSKSKENNYSQLVYKTKLLLTNNGFPKDFIMTIPRYGLCINNNFTNSAPDLHKHSAAIFNDHVCLR